MIMNWFFLHEAITPKSQNEIHTHTAMEKFWNMITPIKPRRLSILDAWRGNIFLNNDLWPSFEVDIKKNVGDHKYGK